MGNICCGQRHEAFNPVLTFPEELDDDAVNEIRMGQKKEPTMKMRL